VVRDSGTAKLYVNSSAAGTSASAPNPQAGLFGVAARPENPALDNFSNNGYVDEVRVFTFVPGSFTTNDLLLVPHIVTVANDSGGGSLRATVANAPTNATITFAPNPSGQTILLTNGQVTLAKNVTIDGSALARPIQINGRGKSRLFYVNSGVTVTNNSLVMTNGNAIGGYGGGIYNYIVSIPNTFNLTDSIIALNSGGILLEQTPPL
jgi:hypothetical protein